MSVVSRARRFTAGVLLAAGVATGGVAYAVEANSSGQATSAATTSTTDTTNATTTDTSSTNGTSSSTNDDQFGSVAAPASAGQQAVTSTKGS